jgi:NTE family protein
MNKYFQVFVMMTPFRKTHHRIPMIPDKSRILSTLLILFISTVFLIGQPSSGNRPKIGYVLSGGGAKGIAHVGVLKVLEEVGLQPDVITGTSMGSIIGGLYSIGYSAEDLSQLIESTDWSTILTNEIPSNQVIMRRKHEYNRFMLQMPVYNRKPQLPSGLIEGQKLSQLFSELTWEQAGVEDFHDFPVPYTCIATDLLKGEMVEINSGDLSSAMRSSMAIPSVFTPVLRDSGRILVDGGVVRNFPVQEAIDMGADIIIGVYVGFEREMNPEELRSLTSIMTRTSLLAGSHDVEDQIRHVDLLIVPDLGKYTSADFSDGVAIMNLGEEGGRKRIDQLRALADSINALQRPPEIHRLPSNDSLFISEIRVENTRPSMTRFIIEKSELEEGTWLHPEELNAGIDRLFGTLFFDRIDYAFESMEEGYRLALRIQEKPTSTISTAVHYDNYYGPGVILNYTNLNSLVDGSRASVTLDLSGKPQFRGYYDIHLGKKRGFIVSPFADGERATIPEFNNGLDIGDLLLTYYKGGVAVRQMIGTNNQVGLEFYYRYSRLKVGNNVKEARPEYAFWDQFILRGPELKASFKLNTLDHFLYPTRGMAIEVEYRQAFQTRNIIQFAWPDSIDNLDDQISEEMDPYWRMHALYESYFRLGKRFSLNLAFSAGLSSNDKPGIDNFYIGGYRYNMRSNQVPFVGLHHNEDLTGNFVKEKIALQFNPIPKLYASILANLMFFSSDINSFWDEIISYNRDQMYIGAGAGLTYKSPIGPLSVYLGSRTDVWNPIWYVNLGFTF